MDTVAADSTPKTAGVVSEATTSDARLSSLLPGAAQEREPVVVINKINKKTSDLATFAIRQWFLSCNINDEKANEFIEHGFTSIELFSECTDTEMEQMSQNFHLTLPQKWGMKKQIALLKKKNTRIKTQSQSQSQSQSTSLQKQSDDNNDNDNDNNDNDNDNNNNNENANNATNNANDATETETQSEAKAGADTSAVLSAMEQKMNMKIDSIQKLMAKIQSASSAVNVNGDQCKKQILTTFGDIFLALKERRKQLLMELNQEMFQKHTILKTQQQNIFLLLSNAQQNAIMKSNIEPALSLETAKAMAICALDIPDELDLNHNAHTRTHTQTHTHGRTHVVFNVDSSSNDSCSLETLIHDINRFGCIDSSIGSGIESPTEPEPEPEHAEHEQKQQHREQTTAVQSSTKSISTAIGSQTEPRSMNYSHDSNNNNDANENENENEQMIANINADMNTNTNTNTNTSNMNNAVRPNPEPTPTIKCINNSGKDCVIHIKVELFCMLPNYTTATTTAPSASTVATADAAHARNESMAMAWLLKQRHRLRIEWSKYIGDDTNNTKKKKRKSIQEISESGAPVADEWSEWHSMMHDIQPQTQQCTNDADDVGNDAIDRNAVMSHDSGQQLQGRALLVHRMLVLAIEIDLKLHGIYNVRIQHFNGEQWSAMSASKLISTAQRKPISLGNSNGKDNIDFDSLFKVVYDRHAAD